MIEILLPQPHEIDPGFSVNRMLPRAQKRMIGPFVFWDHMGPVTINSGREISVRPHPHIGLSTLTYLFEGSIFHRDSLGFEQSISPGAVNWMTAGKGIVHSERTSPLLPQIIGQKVHGIQIWIGLPKEKEEIDPSFHHIPSSQVPRWKSISAEFTLIAGDWAGRQSPTPVHSPLFYVEVKGIALDETFTLPDDFEFGVYPVAGSGFIEEKEIKEKHLGYGKGSFRLQAKEPFHFMLFGGKPFDEKRIIWWNFVSSSKEKMEEAKLRWANQEMGQVVNESEFIPLPQN